MDETMLRSSYPLYVDGRRGQQERAYAQNNENVWP